MRISIGLIVAFQGLACLGWGEDLKLAADSAKGPAAVFTPPKADESIRPLDPKQTLERTCFQTGRGYGDFIDLQSDVAIVYGIDAKLPDRIKTWRDKGYRIHVMTGVSWGNYQDYLYGRFDGVNHEDEAQTERSGKKISHGGDVYYMCPGENYGKFLCVGVKRALEAGAEAIHLEEPEFWVRGGYSEGFKREWRKYYGEDWTAPHTSPDAQWKSSKLKYYLYRRALQQVFDFIQAWNKEHGKQVRCYVPTHSLLNYAHWRIVSPESSLARLQGCDGYIAQVWTGTSRTPNVYRGQLKERTFETAFLEYGAMQNLVRSTGRTVWYLNDPVEDNPNHDWEDYRTNWESTLVASLLQPEVWQYEVMPWPERIFGGRYPSRNDRAKRESIPPAYATEMQTVINALNDMNQPSFVWDCGMQGAGILVGDSLMFQRGDPTPSDNHMSHLYGLALPLVKRGIPVEPVQLENVVIKDYLRRYRLLIMTYQGMKPLSPDVHTALAHWVRSGGVLMFCDDDSDPYLKVSEWWNTQGMSFTTPRLHLFAQLGLSAETQEGRHAVGRGTVYFLPKNPVGLASDPNGDTAWVQAVQQAIPGSRLKWRETNYLLLRRGPYIVGAGLDESIAAPAKEMQGRFVDLFDSTLQVMDKVVLNPGMRCFLIDLDKAAKKSPALLASACKAWPGKPGKQEAVWTVEGVANTQAMVLLRCATPPKSVTLGDTQLTPLRHDPVNRLLWLRFDNQPTPRKLLLKF